MGRSVAAQSGKVVALKKKSQQQFWRTSILTFTCGATISGALVKFAIDHMPPDEAVDSPNRNSVQATAQDVASSIRVAAIASPEKITLPKIPVQKSPPKPVVSQPKQSATDAIALAPSTPLVIQPPSGVQVSQPVAFVRPPQVQPVIATFPREDRPRQFRDIQGHWAQYFIETLATQKIVQGYSDRTFRPDAAIAPAEFAQMLRNAFPESNVSMSFRDLQAFARSLSPSRAEAAMLIHQTRTKSEMVLSVTDMTIQGEVNRPGRYSLAGLGEQDPKLSQLPTVARAIEYAGGLQASADLSRVQVHRMTEAGQKRIITVDLQNPRHDLVLEQGDEIVIPSSAVAKVR